MKTLRFAIAGYGYIADVHARAIHNAAGASLAGVWGRSKDKRKDFAAKHGGVAFGSIEEMLESPDVDVIINALPNALHAPVCTRAFEHGKHVLVEKPMAMNAIEARQMSELADKAGVVCLVGHMWRFDREARWLRSQIASGRLGEVVKTKGYGIHTAWGPDGWFVDPAMAGGGALIDMGVHAIDTARYLLGDPEPATVYALLQTRFGAYAVDDVGVIVIEWDNGAISMIESGWWNPHMDGPEASTQIFGTKGYARLFPTDVFDLVDGKLAAAGQVFPERVEHCDLPMYTAQIEGMVEAVRDGKKEESFPGPRHGTCIMEICDAAYVSAREGRVVRI